MSQLEEITEEIRQVDTDKQAEELYKSYQRKWDEILQTVSDDQWKDVQTFIIVCLECGHNQILNLVVAMFSKRKLIQWKKHPEIFDKFFDTLLIWGMKSEKEKPRFWRWYDFSDVVDKLLTLLKSLQMSKQYSDRCYDVIIHGMSSAENRLVRLMLRVHEFIPWPKHVDKIRAIMERTYEIVVEYPEMPSRHDLANVATVWTRIFQSLMEDGAEFIRIAKSIVDVVAKVFNYCAAGEMVDPDDFEKNTLNHELCQTILQDYLQRHRDHTEILKPMFEAVLKLRDSEDEIMQRDANNLLQMLRGNITELMGDRMGTVIDNFVENTSLHDLTQMDDALKSKPEAFKNRVNDIANAILDNFDPGSVTYAMSFLWELAKVYPNEFSKEAIEKIVHTLSSEESYAYGMLPLAEIAAIRKRDILPYDDAILACMENNTGMQSRGTEILIPLSSLGKQYAVKYMRALVRIAKSTTDHNYAMNFIYNLGVIGGKYPEELSEHVPYLTELLDNPNMKAYAQQVLDIAAGRSLQTVSAELEDQKEDIKQIDDRVTETEQRVDVVEQDVKRIDKDVENVKTDMKEQGEKIGELEVVVDETVEKVEEIDKKTLSHAPVWSRDVAKLMNFEAEHDWRFLATRLGYSNDDIKNWATQPDPCLSLLDEWFATHKTREATFAVEQALNEMNRTDAAMIVENALKMAEDVVEEDDTEEWEPPPIFISYQWALQQEVKLLHKHLEMAGYKSWMDIGQMGGGDKLFAKIDQGIRAAKVVICCVSEKYAKSANCNREVNLAVTLGKPIIPLLMEKLSWPPPGSMGPIFGEYIFVRFFARPGETAGDDRYWPTAKFQELLMQIRYSHAPDATLIASDLYRDWWDPPEEIIVIQAKENKPQAVQSSSDEKNEEQERPEVFISYQWGKQPQIKKLYRTLTTKGYTCWLDIMQMGGGDSLYDKIDKGIRGCNVVLSCVTSKYALSANCRREVSLADALKKPIVPLLLEKATWPPEGPMSMVFTQLLYIDFCKPNIEVQNSWECPQMNELYGKLVSYVPRMKPIAEAKDSASQKTKESLTECKDEKKTNKSAEEKPTKEKSDSRIEEADTEEKVCHEKKGNDSAKEEAINRTKREEERNTQQKAHEINQSVSNTNINARNRSQGEAKQKSSSCLIL